MSDLAEICSDVKAYSAGIRPLITEPDIAPTTGRSKPHSTPPGNQAVLDVYMDLHAAVREIETNFAFAVHGRIILRGGSDANTDKALDAISRLGEAVDDRTARYAWRELNTHLTRCMQLPAIGAEEPLRKMTVDQACCPTVGCPGTMIWARNLDVGCFTCKARGVIMPGMLSDGYVVWDEAA